MTVGGRRILTWVPLGVLVIATAAAAGVSIASSPASTTAAAIGSTPIAPRLWFGFDPASTSSRSDPNERAAVTEAEKLLATVTVPTDWTPVSRSPTKALDTPGAVPGTPNLVDLYQYWTTGGSWPSVLAFIVAHPPPGSSQNATGTATAGTVVSSSVTDGLPTAGSRFNTRQVLLTVAPRAGGIVGIRVDAQVIWYPTRPPAERVPAGATRVTATVFRHTSLTGTTTVVLATANFTSPSVVARLARRVDSLPLALPGVRHCPDDSGTDPQLTLTFSGPPGVPVVVVRDDSDGCGSVSFTRGTRSEPALTDDGLLDEVESLLGLHSANLMAP